MTVNGTLGATKKYWHTLNTQTTPLHFNIIFSLVKVLSHSIWHAK